MTSETPDSEGRDRMISTLDGLIRVLDLAKDACGIPSAQAAFGAVSILITMIRVCHPILQLRPSVHVFVGLDGQQRGLCRPWDRMR